MTIETLIKALPPPLAPTYVFDGPWEPIEAAIGLRLPEDYKELARIYGSGTFMGFISIYDAVGPDPDCQLVPELSEVRRFFRQYWPDIPIYPQPGGLLACGSTNTGEYLFWLTRGLVSEWPIVVWDHDCLEGEELELFEYDLTNFLAGLVTGEIRPRAFPEDMELQPGETAFESRPQF